MIREFAPAKINLYLHVTGRRPDGYHQLDSLTAFAGVGDEIRLEPAPRFDFIVDGPQAAALRSETDDNNLVVRAARALAEHTGKALDLRLTLIKNLPVASGIGGGSSDAAAALRALAQHWGLAPDDMRLLEVAASCGQDVPVCLAIENCYITADGMAPGPELPHTHIVLANPGMGLGTAGVYQAFREGGDRFSPAARLKEIPRDAAELAAMLNDRHNDLAPAALRLMPEISRVIDALQASPGCLLARMSGSGASCFGLYEGRDHARRAAVDILAAHPGWWVIQSHIPSRRDRRRGI
ncbi:MAG: 4-(cytidine 5'-diphospho)-2-C-methyl-D-erythritol kinase [Bdellovibrionales bacterium]